MRTPGLLFIAGVWIVGLATGFAVLRWQAMNTLPIPQLTVPLLAAFLVEVALLPMARAGRLAPVTMNERGIAVIGAAAIGMVVTAALA